MKLLIYTYLMLSSASAETLKGTATSNDSQKVIYTEIHEITKDDSGHNRRIETKYFNPSGQQFAEMRSDFSKNLLIPDVKFVDQRFDRTEEITLNPENNTVTFVMTQGSKAFKPKEIKVEKNMVAGQGFDNFVRINFENIRMSSVPLKFGVLSEMDFFSFKAYSKREAENNNVVRFGIKLTNLLYRVLAEELLLEYHPETKKLLSYRGLSNVLSDKGKSQSVYIKYDHNSSESP